jgi:membrane-bound metal-dependent hydrolase YbcI (DUF457 family)
MFFFGHMGITAGAVQGINRSMRPAEPKIDLRKAIFVAILPDLIDKPVGLLYPIVFGNHTRLWGHSLAASIVLLVLLLIFGQGRRAALIFWSIYLGHFLLDRLWIADAHAFLWPFFGTRKPLNTTILHKWEVAITQPWTIFGEIAGISILSYLIVQYRLYKPAPRRRFFRTGILDNLT